MSAPAIPEDEEERLRTLYEYQILDTMEESSFDAICQLASTLCGTSMSLINLIDRKRQWTKAATGIDVKELDRDCSMCAHAILEEEIMVVENAENDARFCDNEFVVSLPHVKFYAGKPLHAFDGKRLGTLCVVDTHPRQLSEEQKWALQTLARQVEQELELRRLNRELAQLDSKREQIAQFLAHDLSNPMAAIRMLTDQLGEELGQDASLRPLIDDLSLAGEKAHSMVKDLRDISTAGAGHLAPRRQTFELEKLRAELEAITRSACQSYGVSLHWEDEGLKRMHADPDLMARVLQNLVFNAIEHTPEGGNVTARFRRSDDDGCSISVEDEGVGLTSEDAERVFDLYKTSSNNRRRESRGIGLAFCRSATEAHGGTIGAEAREPRGTRFWVKLPASCLPK